LFFATALKVQVIVAEGVVCNAESSGEAQAFETAKAMTFTEGALDESSVAGCESSNCGGETVIAFGRQDGKVVDVCRIRAPERP